MLKKIKVSVIIITKNRPDSLRKCIEHLRNQEYQEFETIIVDSSTNYETRDVVKLYRDIKYVYFNKGKNMAISRNIGINNSSGEIIAFIDDDAFVQGNWLDEIVKGYTNEKIGGIGGRVIQDEKPSHADNGSSTVCRITPDGLLLGYHDYEGIESFPVDYIVGTNMSFRMSVLKKLGGYDPVFKVWNDIDISMRVRNLGYYINFNPKAKLVHKMLQRELIPREKKTLTSQYVYKRSHAYALFKNAGFKYRYFKTLFYWDFVDYFKNKETVLSLHTLALSFANLAGKISGLMLSLKVNFFGEKNYLQQARRCESRV